jgi:hypothetical protein
MESGNGIGHRSIIPQLSWDVNGNVSVDPVVWESNSLPALVFIELSQALPHREPPKVVAVEILH